MCFVKKYAIMGGIGGDEMGLKEDMQKRKERREAMQYFRSNNDAFLSPAQYAIVIVCILVISLVCGFIQAAITSGTTVRFGIVYLLSAFLIAKVAKKTSSFVNPKVRVICYIGYALSIIATPIFNFAIAVGLQYLPALILEPQMWVYALNAILRPDIFGWIFYILGAAELTALLK